MRDRYKITKSGAGQPRYGVYKWNPKYNRWQHLKWCWTEWGARRYVRYRILCNTTVWEKEITL